MGTQLNDFYIVIFNPETLPNSLLRFNRYLCGFTRIFFTQIISSANRYSILHLFPIWMLLIYFLYLTALFRISSISLGRSVMSRHSLCLSWTNREAVQHFIIKYDLNCQFYVNTTSLPWEDIPMSFIFSSIKIDSFFSAALSGSVKMIMLGF